MYQSRNHPITGLPVLTVISPDSTSLQALGPSEVSVFRPLTSTPSSSYMECFQSTLPAFKSHSCSMTT